MDEKSEFKRSIIQTASQSGMVSENFQEAESNARFLYSKPEVCMQYYYWRALSGECGIGVVT
jgi:hypothetical protein